MSIAERKKMMENCPVPIFRLPQINPNKQTDNDEIKMRMVNSDVKFVDNQVLE